MGGRALLGAVRDLDVLISRVAILSDRLAQADRVASEEILAALRDDRRLRHLELIDGLSSPRHVALIDELVAASHTPPLGTDIETRKAKPVLRKLVRKTWRRTARGVTRLSRDPSDAELHEIRKRAKRARYASELAQPIFGKPAARLAQYLEEVQDVLGALQDTVVAEDYLSRIARRGLAGGPGYAAGTLSCFERDARIDARRSWRTTWNSAQPGRLRRWLH